MTSPSEVFLPSPAVPKAASKLPTTATTPAKPELKSLKIRFEFKTKDEYFDVWSSINGVCERFQQTDKFFSILSKDDPNNGPVLKNFKTTDNSAHKFKTYFETTKTKRQGDSHRHWIIATITMSKTLMELKEANKAHLHHKEIYVYVHRFDQAAVSTAGFLAEVHPDHIHREVVIDKLNNLGQEKGLAFDCVVRNWVFVSENPDTKQKTKTSTKVLEIHCPSSKHASCVDFLESTDSALYCSGATYIPYHFKRSFSPEKLNLVISQHHVTITDLSAIPITGLKPSLLAYKPEDMSTGVSAQILNHLEHKDDLHPIHSIQPTNRSASEGRHLIICHKDMKDLICSRLDKTLHELQQSDIVQNNPEEFMFEGTQMRRTNASTGSTNSAAYRGLLAAKYGEPAKNILDKQQEQLAIQHASKKRSSSSPPSAWKNRHISLGVIDQKEYRIIAQATEDNSPPNKKSIQSPPRSSTPTAPETNAPPPLQPQAPVFDAERFQERMEQTVQTAIASAIEMAMKEQMKAITQLVATEVQNATHELIQRIEALEQEAQSHRQYPVHAHSPSTTPATSQPNIKFDSLGKAVSGQNSLFRNTRGIMDKSMDLNMSRISQLDDEEHYPMNEEETERILQEAHETQEAAALQEQGRGGHQ